MSNQAKTLSFLRVGDDVMIWPVAKVVSPENISIGDSVIIDDFVFIMGGEQTIIGSFIHIASFTSITGGGKLIMEDFSAISSGCRVFTGNDDYSGGCLTGPTIPPPYREPIRSFVHLEKHALIGANTVILPGVTIGQGTTVGANSLVKSDLEPWAVYVGSPVKRIGTRPKDRILEYEEKLRAEFYDSQGHYIPRNLWSS